eukprot:TRINITY_DN19825_c0_g1_i2.p1 TRINITY_DN19825_c0_g1~~TRINITY_DN19825_c0_g1_i2.p1  ORF type:complete len:163 (-),score=34.25 TRINITY_DN19825_c0_g1_i2:67-555(-)
MCIRDRPATSHPPNVCWPVGGEIDIMEAYRPAGARRAVSDTEEDVLMTYHWAEECNKDLFVDGAQGRIGLNGSSWSDEWHTFGVDWSTDRIDWYVDGKLQHSVSAGTPASLFVPQDPFYMILNTALEPWSDAGLDEGFPTAVSYTHLRAHETVLDLVCRLLL